ncbi:CGNR zinc finger [Streptomyces sp. PTY087I2]|nr:CGNR zinc finger [Streptomyces sp. PTY087I2]
MGGQPPVLAQDVKRQAGRLVPVGRPVALPGQAQGPGDGGTDDQGAAREGRGGGRVGVPGEDGDDPRMGVEEALRLLNEAAALEPVAPQLRWPAGENPTSGLLSAEDDPGVRLVAALARDAVDFLSGPQREQLRACHAPRCVRYFIKSHGRQEWCKPSCGNRARVARHYERTREAAGRD